MLPPVKGLIENSLIEWPGRIAAIIFLPNCNFRCPYCHSPHLVNSPNDLESVPFQSVVELVKRRGDWLDGVVVSGGEPTLHEGLPEMLRELIALGMRIRINTNGSRPDVLGDLAEKGLIDSVAMDVKAPLDASYNRLSGVDVDLGAISKTIDWLLDGGVAEVEFRTTVVPGMLSEEEIVRIAVRLGAKADYVLQPFRPLDCLDVELTKLPGNSPDELLTMAGCVRGMVKSCKVRGFPEQVVSLSGP